MKLGIQMWSIHDTCKELGPEGTMKLVKDLGYEGFEFALHQYPTLKAMFGWDPYETRDAMQKYGIAPLGSHIGTNHIVNTPDLVLEEAKILGLPYIGVGPSFEGDRMPHEKQKQAYADAVKASRILKENGIQMQVHCAAYGYMLDYKGRHTSEGMIEEAGVEYIQPEFDTAWMICGGIDPIEFLKKYQGYIDVLHFKDFHPPMADSPYILVRHNSVVGCAVGDNGIQDVEAIMKAAKEYGTKWVVTELWNEPEQVENARISAENLRKYL